MTGPALVVPRAGGAAGHACRAIKRVTAVGAFADENGSPPLRMPLANLQPAGFRSGKHVCQIAMQ
jgi:hypothetical protein